MLYMVDEFVDSIAESPHPSRGYGKRCRRRRRGWSPGKRLKPSSSDTARSAVVGRENLLRGSAASATIPESVLPCERKRRRNVFKYKGLLHLKAGTLDGSSKRGVNFTLPTKLVLRAEIKVCFWVRL